MTQQCKENIFAIQTLKDFQHIEDNKDLGANVREKAKALVALLKDDERLKNERAKALKAKERFAENFGIGSDQSQVCCRFPFPNSSYDIITLTGCILPALLMRKSSLMFQRLVTMEFYPRMCLMLF